MTEQPAESQPTWSEKLQAPFPDYMIGKKPKPSCRECSQKKEACGKLDPRGNHVMARCKECKQWITTAHIHIDFVGHADVTERLNKVDPHWWWEPMQRDVDKDVLIAAAASGNLEIVNAVIANSPPQRDQDGGMWMYLVLHDDDGQEVWTPGYGDAEGKRGPSAMKEVIGDGIRNAAMRRGVALALWSKSERAELDADNKMGEQKPKGVKAGKEAKEPKEAKEDAKPAERRDPAAPPPPESDLEKKVRLLAEDAKKATEDGSTPLQLQDRVYMPARRAGILRTPTVSPFTGQQTPLTEIISAAKTMIEQAQQPPADADADAESIVIDESTGTFRL